MEETFITGPGGEKIFGMWYCKPNCKRCYGRGWQWRDAKTKQPLMCSCMRFVKRVDPVEEEKSIEDIQTSTEAGVVGTDM